MIATVSHVLFVEFLSAQLGQVSGDLLVKLLGSVGMLTYAHE
jgi:hypothetical protein